MPVKGAGRLPGFRVLAAAALVLACVLAGPSTAAAEQFSVNTTADETDAVVGNEFCETAAAKCSLRAAIEEANATLEGFDEIRFEEEAFEGDAESVVELTSALPAIIAPLGLNGRECETEAGPRGPCAEVHGDSGSPALRIEGAEGVEIEYLSLTGAEVGLAASEAERLRVRSSWFGIALDGAAAGNGTGLELAAGSDLARIGGEGPEAGNLFADSEESGLEIVGASKARILGNRFGVDLTGTEVAANATDLRISSDTGSPALDNVVGTRVSASAAETAVCDGGCNLISGSEASGVDLTGSAGAGPPIGTTIAGNQIGLDGSAEGALPNGGSGILVGAASHTLVGGPRPEDANLFVGGTAAVEAGPGAPNLVVRGNRIGSSAAATASEAPGDGIVVDSEGLLLSVEAAQIVDNEIGLDGGTGIAQKGLGGEITGNLVAGAAIGIEAAGPENLIEGNAVEAPEEFGILLKEGFNTVLGNQMNGAGKAGVRVEGTGLFGISGNVIGGNSAAAENEIDDSAGAAIEIFNVKLSRTEVARNRGAGNGGLFIDLIAAPPDIEDLDPGDPNGDIQPPAVVLISETGVTGFADPGATVRVFRKLTPAPGEIESFLGLASADAKGNWTLDFGTPLPVGTTIAATQTLEGGTSELGMATIPAPQTKEGPSSTPRQLPDRKPPRTRMLKQPRRVAGGQVARFAFTASEPGSHFQCSLDRHKFSACASPKQYRGLPIGIHRFRVRAVDQAGNVDRTPVRRRFEVLG